MPARGVPLVLALALAGCGGTAAHPARTAAPVRTVAAAATATASPTAAPAPAYTFSSRRLGPALRARISGSSWHPGCPVPPAGLRYLRIAYWGFDRRAHDGELVVAASAVPAVRKAFGRLFAARFPIRRMRLVDDYGASDSRSIDHDNTSAFNCRNVTGGTGWSEHAYGRAIDIDPIENPYVYPGGKVTHAASRPYVDRSRHRRGMAYRGGVLVRAFAAVHWGWGGDWPPPTDYQHFSATGH